MHGDDSTCTLKDTSDDVICQSDAVKHKEQENFHHIYLVYMGARRNFRSGVGGGGASPKMATHMEKKVVKRSL